MERTKKIFVDMQCLGVFCDEKILDKLKLRGITKIKWPLLFRMFKVLNYMKRPGNFHR